MEIKKIYGRIPEKRRMKKDKGKLDIIKDA